MGVIDWGSLDGVCRAGPSTVLCRLDFSRLKIRGLRFMGGFHEWTACAGAVLQSHEEERCLVGLSPAWRRSVGFTSRMYTFETHIDSICTHDVPGHLCALFGGRRRDVWNQVMLIRVDVTYQTLLSESIFVLTFRKLERSLTIHIQPVARPYQTLHSLRREGETWLR